MATGARDLSGRVKRVDHYGPSERFVGGMASVLTALRTLRLGSDDVRTHATWTPGGGRQVVLVWLRSLASVLVLPRGTVVHVHVSDGGSFVRKGVLLWLAWLRRLPRVATIHGYGFDTFVARFPLLVRGALWPAQAVTVLTDEARGAVEALLPSRRVFAVENPVVRADEPGAAGDRPPVVFFGGEVGTRKGVDVLLDAWPAVRAQSPDARLVVAGPLADVAPPDAPGIEYVGQLGSAEMRAAMLDARVVVLPSRAEARPMVLLEAAACGRPFVATPVGSVADLARAGGVLVPVEDAAALADALAQLLVDAEWATRLGASAFEAAGRRDAAHVSEQLVRVYRAVGA